MRTGPPLFLSVPDLHCRLEAPKTHPVRHRVAVGPLVADPVDHLVEAELAADPEDHAADRDADIDDRGDDKPHTCADRVEKNGRGREDQSPDKVAKRAEKVHDQSKHDVPAGEVLEVDTPARKVVADALEVLAVIGTRLGVSRVALSDAPDEAQVELRDAAGGTARARLLHGVLLTRSRRGPVNPGEGKERKKQM